MFSGRQLLLPGLRLSKLSLNPRKASTGPCKGSPSLCFGMRLSDTLAFGPPTLSLQRAHLERPARPARFSFDLGRSDDGGDREMMLIRADPVILGQWTRHIQGSGGKRATIHSLSDHWRRDRSSISIQFP